MYLSNPSLSLANRTNTADAALAYADALARVYLVALQVTSGLCTPAEHADATADAALALLALQSACRTLARAANATE